MPLQILWVSQTNLLRSGSEFALVEAIHLLKERGYKHSVIVPRNGELGEYLRDFGVKVIEIPYDWWVSNRLAPHLKARRMFYNIRLAAGQFARVIRQSNIDLVVTNTLTVPIGALAAKFAHRPHVWYVHEMFGEEGHDKVFDYGTRGSLFLMNHLSARVIANSEAVRQQLAPYISSRKLCRVYYAVETDDVGEPERCTNRELNLVMVGLLSPGKRQEDAVRAIAILQAKGIFVNLRLVGSAQEEYEAYLRRISAENGVTDRVEFVGFTSEPLHYVRQADIALMCSRGEAFGRATVEAMKAGKPVIGAASGGTVELIQDGWNGYLYRLGDPEALSRKIEILYSDRTRLREMGENAAAWANRTFRRELYLNNLVEVFAEALNTKVKGIEEEQPRVIT